MKSLGIHKNINRTRLKTRILFFPDSHDQLDGRNIILCFEEGLRDVLKDVIKERDFDEEAVIIARATNIIRKDMFNHECFDGWMSRKLFTC